MQRKPRTHTLTISAPLNLERSDIESSDIQAAMAEAVRVIIPLTQLGTLGLLCDQVEVTMLPNTEEDQCKSN